MDRQQYYADYYKKHRDKKLQRAKDYYETHKEEINKIRSIKPHFYFGVLPVQKISFT
jgi:hypothetical protein